MYQTHSNKFYLFNKLQENTHFIWWKKGKILWIFKAFKIDELQGLSRCFLAKIISLKVNKNEEK